MPRVYVDVWVAFQGTYDWQIVWRASTQHNIDILGKEALFCLHGDANGILGSPDPSLV